MKLESPALLRPVLDIARAAGRETLAVLAQGFEVAHKADRSPVTEADLRAQRVILERLTALTPGVPVLSEEGATIAFADRKNWQDFWLVDPLDGTREFVAGSPQFTVNIALIREGEPLLGIVHVPVGDVSYYAARATGRGDTGEAFRQVEGEAAASIRVASATASVRVLGSKSHRGDSLGPMLGRLGAHELIPVGSSLKFCLVAEGAADLYPRLGPTSEWDTAAGQAVLECAGGRVVDLTGKPLRYNRRETLINPDFVAFGDDTRNWLSYF